MLSEVNISGLRRQQGIAPVIARLIEAKDTAEAANAAKSAFLATLCHEIRTPINAILGMSNVLRRTGVTPEQTDCLNKVDSASSHLLGIINRVLDISRIEAGRLVLEENPVCIPELVESACAMVRGAAQDKGIELGVECDVFPVDLQGDATQLRQALLNYLANAIKFTPAGRVTLRALMQEATPDWVVVRFEVQDTGIGIPRESLLRLFSDFEQGERSTAREFGGTGLGLAITARLAESMGGTVGVQSSPGVGSLFWLTARLVRKVDAESSASVEIDAEALLRERFAGCRVLVVEDDPVSRTVTHALLQDVGLVVDLAQDGLQAIRRVGEADYAAILMDMRMPGLDGLATSTRIRAMPGCAEVPILAMTANVFVEDQATIRKAGMNELLPKPFSPRLLYAMLLRWLES